MQADQKSKLFRKVALERLASPEQLDRLMQITTPRGWLALLVLGFAIVALVIWSILGQIPTTIDAQGILLPASEGEGAALEALIYVSIFQAQGLKPGMEVRIAPISVFPQQNGYIKGEIITVGQVPVVNEYAQALLPGQPAIEVRVKLRQDADTPSGYEWTMGEGPDTQIVPGTVCTAQITTKKERPISRVLPILE